MRILVTGSRHWSDYNKVIRGLTVAIDELSTKFKDDKTITIVHGGARGADSLAADFVVNTRSYFAGHGYTIKEEVHPANWNKYGKGAGPIRNQEMVDAGADICVAFLAPNSRGTKDCAARARAAKIKVLEFN